MNAVMEVAGLRKRFGAVDAVRDVTFAARAGRVTGFLGPNGAGKSTTLRMLLGLVRPDSGSALINGRSYRDLASPTRTVGAVLDIASAHPRMTARAHLRTYCALGGLPNGRVEAVLSIVEASEFADRRIGTFSTGMRQRLSLATALLGDPEILVLDEPSNGLDPAGIAWMRGFLRAFAAGGGTVLLSSHVLSEVEHSVDDVIVIDRGQISWAGELSELLASSSSLEDAFLHAIQGAHS
ncbi:ABC transporter ATP-binding protein [Microbacterium sp. TWP3-1-2b2]|uniref:ABC transporter ATP-binding protein n=1 Tax=Microbacterium sp. TWP3-1-2b2 TaxID=2804651 RepID=UPI003CFAFE92